LPPPEPLPVGKFVLPAPPVPLLDVPFASDVPFALEAAADDSAPLDFVLPSAFP